MDYAEIPYSDETKAKLQAVLKDPANPLYAPVSKLWNEFVQTQRMAAVIRLTAYGAKVQAWQQEVRHIQIRDLLEGTQTPLPPKPVNDKPEYQARNPFAPPFLKMYEPVMQAKLEAVLSDPSHPLFAQISRPYETYFQMTVSDPNVMQGVTSAQAAAQDARRKAEIAQLIASVLNGPFNPNQPIPSDVPRGRKAAANLAPASTAAIPTWAWVLMFWGGVAAARWAFNRMGKEE